MPDDPITFRQAYAEFASKEALNELRTLIRSSEDRILQRIDGLHDSFGARVGDVEKRLREAEIATALLTERVQRVEKPSPWVQVAYTVATTLITSVIILVATVVSGHHV